MLEVFQITPGIDFFIDFATISAPSWGPKCTQNRHERVLGKLCKNCIDLLSFVSQLGWRPAAHGNCRGLPRLLGNTSPGLWTGVVFALVTTYIQFFRHPGHHHFSSFFQPPFYIDSCSILAPNLPPKSLQNPLKIDFKSDLEKYQHFS